MSGPTADEIARWAEMHHGWTPEDYPDSGEFCVECGEHMPCPTTRLLALVAAQAEQIAGLRGNVGGVCIMSANFDASKCLHRGEPEVERLRAELAAIHATDDYQRWARAVVERDAAREAVERVRDLHTSYVDSTYTRCCAHEGDVWPCSTIAALDPEPPR